MGFMQWYHAMKIQSKLTKEEKEACTILSELRYNANNAFFKCKENDEILERAKKKLNGRDPIEFMKKLFGNAVWENDMTIAQIDNLK